MTPLASPLQRIEHDNGLVTLQSERLRALGLIHGFSTRLGGISEGPYASLNLAGLEKNADSDANTSVAENFRRLRAALGCHRMPRVVVRQVHGAEVWVVPARPVAPHDAPQADALVSDQPGKLLTVRVADCAPVLLGATGPDGARVVAAVHAGWRGVVAGVVPRTVDVMRDRFGVDAGEMVAAVGPCIGLDRFEVGHEVAEAFVGVGLGEAVRPASEASPRARPHIDLSLAVRMQLQRAGVGPEHIDAADHCTFRDESLFFSYRRDGVKSGRLAAVIAIP